MINNYSRRDFIKMIGATAAGSLLPIGVCKANKLFSAKTVNVSLKTISANMPNIVYILADDMGYGDPECNNPDSKIPTPNMNLLASHGMRFTDAHSGSAVCTPTRYGILTGRYCWRSSLKNGVLFGYAKPLIETSRLTVPSMLKTRGYTTGGVGKWHLGLGYQTTDGGSANASNVDYSKPILKGPTALGFDYYYGIPSSLDIDPYFYFENDRAVEAPTGSIGSNPYPSWWRSGKCAPGFKHKETLGILTQKAVEYIDSHAGNSSSQPFFLYFPLTAPHQPWLPADDFVGKSSAGIYGDFVHQVDWTIGQVMQALERNGIAQNTLLIVTSDNGSHTTYIDKSYNHKANYHFRGQKADIWDGGHRIPFFARWPEKIKAGTSCDQTICLTDLMATVAKIVDIDLPANSGQDSENILAAMLGKPISATREAVVHHSSNGTFAIRQGKWKLAVGNLGSGGFTSPQQDTPGAGEPGGQLYDLESDIDETENLWFARQDIVTELTALLNQYKNQGYSRQGAVN